MSDIDELQRVELALIDALNIVYRVRSRLAGGEIAAAQPEWMPIADAAFKLGLSERAAWRHAQRIGADWPQPGVRQVDFTKLRRVRPPRA